MCTRKMSAVIGATFYETRDYDTVYYDELAQRVRVMGIGDSMEHFTTMDPGGAHLARQDSIMTARFYAVVSDSWSIY